ncbi:MULTISPECIES: alpha/beta fold hydrolase [Ectopseudomonas]|uniref:Alpha/beta fold hydrolase n=2 Tax=Gammaproteobacteria TaxID=1236 RepID=A0A2W5XJ36_ECTOL|nr:MULTISPECIES: alpha/beta fold hydrolase [Pseudomonas aeruginosa group]MBN7116986.1 alpha/beta hydrolase [Pseudomonas oleovorans]MBN7134639.1 alpha/beta hydrolase [Pseudomonas oleovorans]MBN7140150.1 alpha/beta hydrolase [Pseudomonas oleovorans]MCR1828324.1 alpha/beta fold hydrolase [Pseudomonas oleovorans]MDG9979828.1 alpha/beta fold hydrolase [Pseudomonas oleovorans]
MKKLLFALLLLLSGSAATLYFVPATQLASLRLIEQYRAGLSHEQLSVHNLNIHYYRGGPASGETLVLLHGFAADKDNWLRFSRPLTQDYRVIALDLPGFGDSDLPPGSYDVGTQAERLADILDELGVQQAHVLGNSMGGQIAALFAARYPERVRSLALFANAGIESPHKSELYQLLTSGSPNPLVVKQPQDFDKLLRFVFVEPPYLPESLKRYLGERAMAKATHYDQVFKQLVERPVPLAPELPKIQAPTLLLWGRQDRVLDVSSIEVMQPLLNKPNVVIMDNVGHAPMLERPEESALLYRGFLEGLK